MSPTATIDARGVSCQEWDAIVVGAGPAGSMAARELARGGLSVLLVDRQAFPRWKVCGACLNSGTLSVLRRAGLRELLPRLGGIPLQEFRVAGWSRQASIPLPPSVSVSRQAFDAALIDSAVEAGVQFLPRASATLLGCTAERRGVGLSLSSNRIQVGARVVVAADGLGGAFLTAQASVGAARRSRIGAGAIADHAPDFYQPGKLFMAIGTGGYVGLVRLEDSRLNIAAAFDKGFVRRAGGPATAAGLVLREAEFPPIGRLASLIWKGTPELTRRRAPRAAERVFAIGDAAGYIEPFTGEGICWALSAALMLTPIAVRAARAWETSLIGEWRQEYRTTILRAQRLCQAVAWLLRKPALARAAIHSLAWSPKLAGPFVRHASSNLLQPTHP